MATVSKKLADKIIAANGYYSDDPRVQQIIRYTTQWGQEAYAILYRHDVATDRYHPSQFVIDPVVIWEASR